MPITMIEIIYVHMEVVVWSAFLFVKYEESKFTVFVIVLRVFIVSEYINSIVISPSDGTASKSAVVYSFESKSPTIFCAEPFTIIFSCFGIFTVRASTSDDSMFNISNVISFVA